MNTGQERTEEIPSVADVEAAIAACDIALQAYEEEAGQGDERAPLKLANATRERQRLADSLIVARKHEAALARVEQAKAKNVAAQELVTVRETIAARRPVEVEHADRVAALRIDLESREAEMLAYLRDSEVHLRRAEFLKAKAEGKTAGHGGMAAADFRLALLVELSRRKLAPTSPPTRFERFMGSPLWPAKAPATGGVRVADDDGPKAATNGKRSGE